MFTKRKVDADCWTFNEEWENKYFLANQFGWPMFFICIISVNKEFNIKRHYDINRVPTQLGNISYVFYL